MTEVGSHRPWPAPARPWFLAQSWIDLLFAHWRVDAEQLARVVPPQLPLDEIDGSAWIGVTPFEIRGHRLRLTPPVPLLSRFPELNVRTYVTVDDRPGIYFLSLDAASRLAVAAARRTYRLPYFHSAMGLDREAGWVRYRSARRGRSGSPAGFRGAYRPRGPAFNAVPGTRDWLLIERYCAYTLDSEGDVLRAEIQHPPWALHAAELDLEDNTMTAAFGIPLEGDPLLHFSPRQDVVIWTHRRAARGATFAGRTPWLSSAR